MNSDNNNLFDVLSALDGDTQQEPSAENIEIKNPYTQKSEEAEEVSDVSEFIIMDDSEIFFQETENEVIESSAVATKETESEKPTKKRSGIFSNIIFLIKYLSTSTVIFVVLLFTTNYSAYYNIAMSTIFQKDFAQKSESLLSSVEASSIQENTESTYEQDTPSLESAPIIEETEVFNSIDTLASKAKRAEVDLGITITPYENRVIIPKIGRNIPLIDIQQQRVEGIDELNDIFMEELENGVIRYPGSAKPGEEGNTFVFGHSSNFPWMKGDYNDVFSLLDKVVYDDEIIVYYGQKEYVYKIRTKEVIRPGDVSVLKRNKGKSEITLMTCWPIGTTLNRLILIGELIDIR